MRISTSSWHHVAISKASATFKESERVGGEKAKEAARKSLDVKQHALARGAIAEMAPARHADNRGMARRRARASS